MNDAPPEQPKAQDPAPDTTAERTGHAGLDARLADGAVDFHRGIDHAQVYISAFLIVAAGILLYAGALGAPFHGRDYPIFVDNPAIQQVRTLSAALQTMPEAPVTVLDLALNATLLGPAPFGFHLISLLLHLGCALLLYLIARRLFGLGQPEPAAMAAGLLLAVHPAAVQNVLYLAGRAELHAAFFALAALWLFLRATPGAGASRPLPLALALACYAIAAGSSPAAIGLPVVVLWADVLRFGTAALRDRWMVHGTAALAIPLMVTAILADMPAQTADSPGLPGMAAMVLQQSLFTLGTGGEAAPAISGLPPGVPMGALLVASALLLATLALLFARSSAALIPLWLLAAAAGSAALASPESWLAAHGAYLAIAGAALLVPWCFSLLRGAGLRTALGLGVAGLLLLAGVASYQRAMTWNSPELLWHAAAEMHPASPAPWTHLGRLAEARAQGASSQDEARHTLLEAREYYLEAGQRAPDDPGAARRLAALNVELGFAQEALAQLGALVRLRPFDPEAARLQGRAHDLALRLGALDALADFAESAGLPGEVQQRIGAALTQPSPEPAALAEAASFLTRATNDEDLASHARNTAAAYARAHNLDPLPPHDQLAWARALYALNNVPAAAEVLARLDDPAVSVPASEFSARVQRQWGLAMQSDQQSAELIADPARQMEALQHRTHALLLRGEHTAAAYLLENLVNREETRESAWQELGALRAGQGQTALFLKEHGSTMAPGSRIWQTLAMRCIALGHGAAAHAYLAAPEAGLEPLAREMALGEAALALRMADRAERILREAAAAHPEAAAPWLRLSDIALLREQPAQATRLLVEAEKRGAEASELEARRNAIREGGVDPGSLPEEDEAIRTIIR